MDGFKYLYETVSSVIAYKSYEVTNNEIIDERDELDQLADESQALMTETVTVSSVRERMTLSSTTNATQGSSTTMNTLDGFVTTKSASAWASRTLSAYNASVATFKTFLTKLQGYGVEEANPELLQNVTSHLPTLIAFFLMTECEEGTLEFEVNGQKIRFKCREFSVNTIN